MRDVTHVTPAAARPFHVILHVSWLDNFPNSDHYFDLICLCSQCVKTYTKFASCLELIDLKATRRDCKGGVEVCDVILGRSRAA